MKTIYCTLLLGLLAHAHGAVTQQPTQEQLEAYERELSARSGELVSNQLSRTTKLKHFVQRAMDDDMGLGEADWLELARINYQELATGESRENSLQSSVCPLVNGPDSDSVKTDAILSRLQALEDAEEARWEGHYRTLVGRLSPEALESLHQALERSDLGPGAVGQELNVEAIAWVDPKMFVLQLQRRCQTNPMRE